MSSSGTSTPARPPPAPLGSNPSSTLGSSSFTAVQSGSATSSEPPLTSLLTASAVALSSPSATLCFHARNIPAISIEAYLQRILKYCPTTNEVFLALLVYFDRMARIGLEARRMGLVLGEDPGLLLGDIQVDLVDELLHGDDAGGEVQVPDRSVRDLDRATEPVDDLLLGVREVVCRRQLPIPIAHDHRGAA